NRGDGMMHLAGSNAGIHLIQQTQPLYKTQPAPNRATAFSRLSSASRSRSRQTRTPGATRTSAGREWLIGVVAIEDDSNLSNRNGSSASGTHCALPRPVTKRRRVLIAALVTAGTLIPVGIIAAARIPFSSDILRNRLIDALEQRLDVDAELDSLTLRFHPSLRAVGKGLVLRSKTRSGVPPLIEVSEFTVDANLSGLWNRRVSFVKLDGLRIQIPPDDGNVAPNDTPRASASASGHSTQSAYWKQIVINNVDAPDAKLIILRGDASKPP